MACTNENAEQRIKLGFQSRKPRMRVMKPPETFHFRIPHDYGDDDISEPEDVDLSCDAASIESSNNTSPQYDSFESDSADEPYGSNSDFSPSSSPTYSTTPEPLSPPRRAAYFDCSLCLRMAREPAVNSCGHLFCGGCLQNWLQFCLDQAECPVCLSSRSLQLGSLPPPRL